MQLRSEKTEESKPDHPSGEYVVVFLDMMLDLDKDESKLALEFYKQSADKQIDHVVRRIQWICDDLLKREPHSTWILVLREYAIQHLGSKIVPYEFKNYYKKLMSSLVMKFPQLIILGGTMAIEHRYKYTQWDEKLEKKLAEIHGAYTLMNKLIGNIERQTKNPKHLQVLKHWSPLKILAQNKRKQKFTPLSIIRNTCYAFQKDPRDNNVMVQRKDKFFPSNETADGNELGRIYLFQPELFDKRRELGFTFYDIFAQTDFHCAISICRDLYFSDLLLKYGTQKQFLFHFVLSATSPLIFSKTVGDYVFSCDSTIYPQPCRIKQPNVMMARMVFAYEHNVFDKEYLQGPLPLIFPFDLKIQRLLADAGKTLPDLAEDLNTVLKQFKEFIDDPRQIYEEQSQFIFDKLAVLLKNLEKHKHLPPINNVFTLFAYEQKKSPITRDFTPGNPVSLQLR